MLVTAVLCAGGCGSGPASTGSHDTTTSAGAGSTTAVTSGATTAASRSGSPPTSRPKVELDTLHLLLTTATSAAGTTFEATYKLSSSASVVTYAQQGSLRSLSTGTATYFVNGSSNTVCSGTPPTCYTGAKPLTGVLAVIIPAQAAGAIRALVTDNVPVTLTSETRGGAMSSCIAYDDQGIPVKYCLDAQGYLTFVKVPGGSFVRTSFSTQVTTALSPPAGATYQPAPAGT